MITTFTGKFINPLALRPEDICIEDIAHSLAMVPRFAGHTKMPIYVGQHSIKVMEVVSRFVPLATDDRTKILLQALLHDASEAYLGDIPKWVKQTEEFAGYRVAEDNAHAVIMQRFGLPYELHGSIKDADKLMVRFEAERGFDEYPFKPAEYDRHQGYERLGPVGKQVVGPWVPWGTEMTEYRFLHHFQRLSSALGFTYGSG